MNNLSQKTIADFERRLHAVADDLEQMVISWEAVEPLSVDGDVVSSLTRARLTSELQRVKVALARLTDDRFGRCTQCGWRIGKERLRADPAVRFCEKCALAGCRRAGGRADAHVSFRSRVAE